MPDYKMLIGGRLVDGDHAMDVINPATEEVFATVARASERQADEAIEAAATAFPAWAETPMAERQAKVSRLADAIVANADKLARALTQEQGKPLAEAQGEIAVGRRLSAPLRDARNRRADDPGRRERADPGPPQAAGGRRGDHRVELPAARRLLEDRPGGDRGQHDRAEARADDAGHGIDARRAVPRASSPQAWSTSSPTPTTSAVISPPIRGSPRSASPDRPRRARRSWRAPPTGSSG